MLHAHVTPKSIKFIWQYSKITGVYIYKNGLVYNIQNVKTYQYIICYWSLTEKTNHLKLITVLITVNLIGLFIKTRHVLKTSQLSLTKVPWTQGLQNIFQSDKEVLLHRQSSDCTPSWCSFNAYLTWQEDKVTFLIFIGIKQLRILCISDWSWTRIKIL